MTPRRLLPEKNIFRKGGSWTLKKGTKVGTVDLPTDFSVSFGLTPTKKINGWANIIHFSATGGNCCSYGDRIPAIWFYSGSTRFHMIDGHAKVGNDECPITDQLPLNKWTSVKIEMLPDSVYVSFNGELKCTEKRQGRKFFSKVYVWASDPWHNVANANIRKLTMTPRRLLPEKNIFRKGGSWTLKKGTKVGTVNLPTDFTVSFGLTPARKINGWANILHVTGTGGNCCNYGDRIPAIWFYSGSTRFHMIDGHQRVGNDECPITQQLPLNKRTAVKIVHPPTQCTVFFNGKKMCTEKRADRRQFREAQVWAADPWHNVAAAKMDNLLIESARAMSPPPPPPPPAKKVTLINGATALKKGRQLARTDMPIDYTVTFDLYPKGKVNGWANIIHFSSNGGNCCQYGQRSPAMWFYSASTRFHMIDGHGQVGNDECPITEQLPLNKWTTVKIEMLPDRVFVYLNGVAKCTERRQDRKFFPKVYV